MYYVTYERDLSHMNASCHKYMSHVNYDWVMPHINESRHATYKWVPVSSRCMSRARNMRIQQHSEREDASHTWMRSCMSFLFYDEFLWIHHTILCKNRACLQSRPSNLVTGLCVPMSCRCMPRARKMRIQQHSWPRWPGRRSLFRPMLRGYTSKPVASRRRKMIWGGYG